MARTISKDYDAKRVHILKTAAQVFAQEGYARASMKQLADACGISKANIYHYYPSKEALLFDILDTYLSELRDDICGLSLDGLSPDEKLETVLTRILLAYEGMDHEHKIQTEGIPLLPEEQQVVLKQYQKQLVDMLGTILAEIAPGSLSNDKRRRYAVTMSVFGMLNWFYMWNAKANQDERRDYARLVARITIDGIRDL